jgi:hypothetical protein
VRRLLPGAGEAAGTALAKRQRKADTNKHVQPAKTPTSI